MNIFDYAVEIQKGKDVINRYYNDAQYINLYYSHFIKFDKSLQFKDPFYDIHTKNKYLIMFKEPALAYNFGFMKFIKYTWDKMYNEEMDFVINADKNHYGRYSFKYLINIKQKKQSIDTLDKMINKKVYLYILNLDKSEYDKKDDHDFFVEYRVQHKADITYFKEISFTEDLFFKLVEYGDEEQLNSMFRYQWQKAKNKRDIMSVRPELRRYIQQFAADSPNIPIARRIIKKNINDYLYLMA